MDALYVQERTGLDYASKATVKDEDGRQKHLMHACGHDMHVTCLLAAASWLSKDDIRKRWSGTLIVVFQPNEERGEGAREMVSDGLYQKVPEPDVVLGQHVMPLRAGQVATKIGTIVSAADSFKVTLYGRGGHGSMPHTCIDPVLLAANVITRLQGIVAREVNPADPAVLTIGSVQSGDTENVIPDEAVLLLDIRSQTENTRHRVLEAMKRIIMKEAETSGCEKPPTIERTRGFPLTTNDRDTTQKLSTAFIEAFGNDFNSNVATSTASEDFSDLASSINKPYCFWFIGGIEHKIWDEAESKNRISEDIPANHSSLFAPAIYDTLRTGYKTLCIAAMEFLELIDTIDG